MELAAAVDSTLEELRLLLVLVLLEELVVETSDSDLVVAEVNHKDLEDFKVC